MGTAGWAQAEAARARIRTVLRAPPDWGVPATRSVPTSTTKHGAPIVAPSGQSLTRPAKLEIGAVDDPLEHEADRIAAQVMHMPATELAPTSAPVQINRKCTACEEEEKLQKKSTETADAGASGALDSVHEVLRSSASRSMTRRVHSWNRVSDATSVMYACTLARPRRNRRAQSVRPPIRSIVISFSRRVTLRRQRPQGAD